MLVMAAFIVVRENCFLPEKLRLVLKVDLKRKLATIHLISFTAVSASCFLVSKKWVNFRFG